MRDMLHRTERRLEGFIIWVSSCFILVKMWFCAFFHVPYKQTVPLSKRPHYSHKSINDRCSQKMEKTETEKELKWVSFFFRSDCTSLLLLHSTPTSRNFVLFTEKIQFSGDHLCAVMGGCPMWPLMAREVNCVTCNCTSCSIKHSNRFAT